MVEKNGESTPRAVVFFEFLLGRDFLGPQTDGEGEKTNKTQEGWWVWGKKNQKEDLREIKAKTKRSEPKLEENGWKPLTTPSMTKSSLRKNSLTSPPLEGLIVPFSGPFTHETSGLSVFRSPAKSLTLSGLNGNPH